MIPIRLRGRILAAARELDAAAEEIRTPADVPSRADHRKGLALELLTEMIAAESAGGDPDAETPRAGPQWPLGPAIDGPGASRPLPAPLNGVRNLLSGLWQFTTRVDPANLEQAVRLFARTLEDTGHALVLLDEMRRGGRRALEVRAVLEAPEDPDDPDEPGMLAQVLEECATAVESAAYVVTLDEAAAHPTNPGTVSFELYGRPLRSAAAVLRSLPGARTGTAAGEQREPPATRERSDSEPLGERGRPFTLTPDTMVLIWSNEHAQWWNPGELGYTDDIYEAGSYRWDRAYEIVTRARPGDEYAVIKGAVMPTPVRTYCRTCGAKLSSADIRDERDECGDCRDA